MVRKTVTIRDVAQRANVSISTVSHVLNGNDQHVGPVKRARVLEAVGALNYRRNAIARSMVKRTTATVGLIITELDNPLFVPVVEGVEEVLRAEGYHIVLASAPDMESEIQAIETLRSQQVDGFIFMSLSLRYPIDHLKRLQEEGVPFVVINRWIEDDDINLVQFDDFGAAATATQHLLQLGHTRIAVMSGPIYDQPPRRSAIERHRGWQETLQEHGLPSPSSWAIVGPYSHEGGYQAAQQLLAHIEYAAERPTALFVANDMMAMGALKAFARAGLRIPHDLAIVTIGDPPYAAYTMPALTTLALPVPEAGSVAARILLDWLTTDQPIPVQKVTLGFTLHIRESCGAHK